MTTIQNKLKNLGINLWLTGANGTWRSNYRYCSKTDKNPWRFGIDDNDIEAGGEQAKSKKAEELEEIGQELEEKTLHAVAKKHRAMYIQASTGIKAMKSILDSERAKEFRPICVTVLYGKGSLQYILN